MKKAILFIHGGGEGAHDADAKLSAHLQQQLGDRFVVHCPQMPDESQPDYTAWKAQLHSELAVLPGEPILVGHSLGGSVLLKFLSEEQVTRPLRGLFLLAPPYWGAPDWVVPEYTLNESFATKLPHGLPIYFYHSSDDGVVPFHHLARYREKLPQAVVRVFEDRGHQFSDDLTEVAEDILQLSDRSRDASL